MFRFALAFAMFSTPALADDRLEAACLLALRIAEEARQNGADLAILMVTLAVERGTEDSLVTEIDRINTRQQQIVSTALADIRRVCLP